MIDLLDDNADCAAIDRALREDEAGDTIPGEIVNAIMALADKKLATRHC